jgi:hypothetical protein
LASSTSVIGSPRAPSPRSNASASSRRCRAGRCPWSQDSTGRGATIAGSANFIGAESCLAIRQRDAYQTRHTFAMLALMASANPMWVARQLGHVDAQDDLGALRPLDPRRRWRPRARQGRGLLHAEIARAEKAWCRQLVPRVPQTIAKVLNHGGWGGIRTHGEVAPTPVFKTGALNRSATHPNPCRRCHMRRHYGGQRSASFRAELGFDPAGERVEEGHEELTRALLRKLALRVEQSLGAADIGLWLLQRRHVEEYERLA